jgi:ABC-type dipeptide/oligopeptide/nickel transport system permease component
MRRLLWVPLILFVVSSVTFTLARLGPGDPISILQGQFRDEEVRERLRHERGLDKPIWEQYAIYMERLLTKGDLGESYRFQGRKVTEILFPAMWRSFQFNIVAFAIIVGVGIPSGIYAARKQGTWADPFAISSFLLLSAIPVFLWVPALWLVFSLKLGILPAQGWPQDCPINIDLLGESYSCIGVVSKEALIPIVALALPSIAAWARYVRSFTLEVLNEDYIRTARSKGMSEVVVMSRHVLRNALLPLSTIIAFSMIGLLEGAFFLETLTGIPGAGLLTFNSIGSRDYDMIMAVVMIGASLFALTSIAIDIVYTYIDPRIRYGARS